MNEKRLVLSATIGLVAIAALDASAFAATAVQVGASGKTYASSAVTCVADPVTNQPQFLSPDIPERNRKHATEFLYAIDAPSFERMQNDFGVGMVRPPAMPAQRLQFTPDRCVVINFSIERHPEGFVFVGHRLAGGLAQVDDREPTMPQADSSLRVDPQSGSVRPPMGQTVPHSHHIGL